MFVGKPLFSPSQLFSPNRLAVRIFCSIFATYFRHKEKWGTDIFIRSTNMIELNKEKVIKGLPETFEEAIAQIDEVESSSSADWQPLESVLNEIEKRYEVYAY